jgi:hypothetical protein
MELPRWPLASLASAVLSPDQLPRPVIVIGADEENRTPFAGVALQH